MFEILFIFAFLPNFALSFVPKISYSVQRDLNSYRLVRNTQSRVLEMVKIALTREEGTNEKLAAFLTKYECLELPCIMFAPGEDAERLSGDILTHDIIAITSPQGAAVLLSAWERASRPDIKIAAVGKGTSKPLIAQGLKPVFEPSDFTAVSLAAELPDQYGEKVLYPTSSLAEDTLQMGLQKRGFQVTRLNTYTTVPSIWNEEMLQNARGADIVTFASPSAVRVWSERVGTEATAVVIGPTSARAAEKAGFTKIISPEGSKGLDAWAMLIADTARTLVKNLNK
eukprot:gene9038-18719_t